ncbi:MAG TPA: hypothetical protein VGH28_23475 [Polyangiaceae bacterium]
MKQQSAPAPAVTTGDAGSRDSLPTSTTPAIRAGDELPTTTRRRAAWSGELRPSCPCWPAELCDDGAELRCETCRAPATAAKGGAMLTRAALIAWGLAASTLASGGARKLSSRVLEGMADAALAAPVVDGDDGARVTMAYEVAIAWLEGGNRADALGDGGASFCWGQVYLPGGARTREGFTGPELAADPHKCAAVVVRIVRASIAHGPADCPLCLYARGRVTSEARRLSAHRAALARRLLATVTLPTTETP